MPEGRLINRKIADSERLNVQPIEARLLYDRLIQFADKEGRHLANHRLLLRRFFPLDDYSDVEMVAWLQGLHDAKKNGVGLVELYDVDTVKYLWLPGFLEEQSLTWFHGARNNEAESTIPPPPDYDRKFKSICSRIEAKGKRKVPEQFANKNLHRPQDNKDEDKYTKGKYGHMIQGGGKPNG